MESPAAAETQPKLTKQPLRILDLPSELLLIISEACSFNAAISLSQSCRQLFLSPGSLSRPHPRCHTDDVYFERLCLDDEYKRCHWDRAVCGVCKMCHALTSFSLQQLERNPLERVCKAAQRLLLVTPDTHWSYQELLQKKSDSSFVTLPLGPRCQGVECTLQRTEDPISHGWIIAMSWWMHLHDRTAAQPLLVICPHMTSAHRDIVEAANGLVSRAQYHKRSDTGSVASYSCRKQHVACRECGVDVQLYVLRFCGGRLQPMIFIQSVRPLGPLGPPAHDPIWMAQSLDANGS